RSYGRSHHQRQRETFDVIIQEQPTEGVRPNARENGRIRGLDQAFGLPEVLVAVSTSRLSCKRAGKTRTLMPVWDSFGESRMKRIPKGLSLLLVLSCLLVLACFGTVLAHAQDPRAPPAAYLRSGTLSHP